MSTNANSAFPLISIVIPARNEVSNIGQVVRSVINQCPDGSDVQVIVVDDGSKDETATEAEQAGAIVIEIAESDSGGNPAAARNRGAASSTGDPIIFLDADCTPHNGWLGVLLAAHQQGIEVVGGSLALAPGESLTARCDYYCGWYHVHPKRRPGFVSNHPPCNLSVRRAVFNSTKGFTERQPLAYAHEELAWQREVQDRGGRIYFEPAAIVSHRNRPGLGNLLRRNYRWGYSTIEAKAESGAARFSWIYRYPRLIIVSSAPLAFVTTVYLIACWLRAKVIEPLWMLPLVFAARVAYSAGMVVGGIRWLSAAGAGKPTEHRPRWE